MSFRQEDYNPLRPYHFPRPVEPTTSTRPNITNSTSSHTPSPASNVRKPSSAGPGLGSSTRDLLSDLDYSDYLNDASPSLVELLRNLFDQGMWKYTSILLAQPFDVAKTVLQVHLASAVEQQQQQQHQQKSKLKRGQQPVRRGSRQQMYDFESDDSGDDSASYFTSAAPLSPRTPTARRMQRPILSRSPSPETPSSRSSRREARNVQSPHTIALASTSSLTAVISHLWQTEGAWGVWKGTNSTFIHSVLLSSCTTFLRSLLCALFALPDPSSTSSSSTPGGLDILSSPSPILSLIAATSASALAAVILAPVDIARTRLILTPSTHPPRSLLPTLRSVGAWFVPTSLVPTTILHGALPTLVSASTPLFCRARLGIDPVVTPAAYAVATFASQAFELAIKLPVETVLRRGQLAFASEQELKAHKLSLRSNGSRGGAKSPSRGELETIVPVGSFRGLVGTMYAITFEEGERTSKTDQAKEGLAKATGKAEAVRPQQGPGQAVVRRRKGQGIEGLYRGWRVGAWGLLGVWSAAMLGGGGKGGEF